MKDRRRSSITIRYKCEYMIYILKLVLSFSLHLVLFFLFSRGKGCVCYDPHNPPLDPPMFDQQIVSAIDGLPSYASSTDSSQPFEVKRHYLEVVTVMLLRDAVLG